MVLGSIVTLKVTVNIMKIEIDIIKPGFIIKGKIMIFYRKG